MGVSFKVSRVGKRYRPEQLIQDNSGSGGSHTYQPQEEENETEGNLEVGDKSADHSTVSVKHAAQQFPEDMEVSFSLNLFPDGFSVGKATEMLDKVPQPLHPYDRRSKKIFSEIEYGYLPGDIFDDLPCKYVNGALLCEIRDFRSCLVQMEDSASPVGKSPIINKILLKMSMENVIKDISSMADDSWTYKDLLEVESRILKAMQPELRLNPKRALDIFGTESMIKKLNLDIPWSPKKRKLSDTPEAGSDFCLATTTLVQEVGDPQNFESPGIIATQSSSSGPPQSSSNCREAGTSVLGDKDKSRKRATPGPILKIPKEETLEYSLLISQSETSLPPEKQWKKKMLQQCYDAEKILHERLHGQKQASLTKEKIQQVNRDVLPKLQPETITPPVTQESESRDLQKSQKPLVSTGVGGASGTVGSSHENDSFLRESSPLGRRKLNSHPEGLRMNIVESLSSVRSVNAMYANSHPAGNSCSLWFSGSKDESILQRFSKIKMVTQRYGLNNKLHKLDKIMDKKPNFETTLVSCHLNSEANQEAVYTGNVSEIRSLNFVCQSQLCKGDSASAPFSDQQAKLVLSKNLNSGVLEGCMVYGHGEHIDSADFSSESTFTSNHELGRFASQFSLLMAREGFYLAGEKIESCPHGNDESSSSQQPGVSSTPIPRKSPYMFSHTTGSSPTLNPRQLQSQSSLSGGHLQQRIVVSGAAPTNGTIIKPLSPTPVPGQPPYLFSSLTSSQLSSHNFLTAGHLLPSGNIQSGLQPSVKFSSNPPLDIAAQASPMQWQWQQIINKRAHLQFQRQQREILQQQLMQRNIMMGGQPASSSTQGIANAGIRGFNNAGLRFSNFTGIGSSSSVPIGGLAHGIGNFGHINNTRNNILGLNERSQAGGAISDPSDAALAGAMVAQNQQRPLLSGVPVQINAAGPAIFRSSDGVARRPPIIHANSNMVAMHQPILPGGAHNMPNQPLQMRHRNFEPMQMHPPVIAGMVQNLPPHAQGHQQLHPTQQQLQLQYQRMNNPFLHPPQAAGFPAHAGLPGRQGILQQQNQQPQMNQIQPEVNAGNVPVPADSVELSLPPFGSGSGSNDSSAMDDSGDSGESSVANTGEA